MSATKRPSSGRAALRPAENSSSAGRISSPGVREKPAGVTIPAGNNFKDEPVAAADVTGDYLREPAIAVSGQIVREGDAPRETGRRQDDGVASSPDTESPSDGGAIAVVKGKARLADAAGVEPPPSDPQAKTWSEMSGPEKRAAVLPLYHAGKSYPEIQAALGATNRNAVAGVINRCRIHGLLSATSKRDAAIRSKRGTKPKPAPAAAKQPGPLSYNIAVKRENRRLEEPAEEPVVIITRAAAFDPLPGKTPIPFLSCGPRQCRWAVDGLDGPSRMFCGADKEPEGPWCPAHRRLAYQPASTTQRAVVRSAERIV